MSPEILLYSWYQENYKVPKLQYYYYTTLFENFISVTLDAKFLKVFYNIVHCGNIKIISLSCHTKRREETVLFIGGLDERILIDVGDCIDIGS